MHTDRTDILRGAVWMLGAVGAFSAMAVAGRVIGVDLDTFEIMTYRSFIGIAVVVTIAAFCGTLRQISTRNLGTQIARNMCHFTGQNLWFYALTAIPMAQVFALEFTNPLWVLLLSPLFLQERMTSLKLFCGFLGFVGILIVARPDASTLNPGTIAAALAAIAFAGTAIFTKLLTRKHNLTTIMFWLVVTQSIMGLVCAGIDGDMRLPDAQSLPGLVVIALGGLTAHFCLTRALSLAPATLVMPVDFLRLPLIAVIAYFAFAESVDIWVFVGGALIFAANYVNVMASMRRQPDASINENSSNLNNV